MRFALSLFVAALGFFSPPTNQPPAIVEPLEVHVGVAPSIYDSMHQEVHPRAVDLFLT